MNYLISHLSMASRAKLAMTCKKFGVYAPSKAELAWECKLRTIILNSFQDMLENNRKTICESCGEITEEDNVCHECKRATCCACNYCDDIVCYACEEKGEHVCIDCGEIYCADHLEGQFGGIYCCKDCF